MKPLISFDLRLCFGCTPLLLDTGFLASELTEIVKLGAANLTMLVHLNAVNVG